MAHSPQHTKSKYNSQPVRIYSVQPYILRAIDMLELSDLWASLTDDMRSVDKSWHLDMYAAVVAARRLGIAFTVERNMIGNAEDNIEPWEAAKWEVYDKMGKIHPRDKPLTVQVIHYCQSYVASSYSWSKHQYHELDIRSCDNTSMFKPLQPEESAVMTEMHGKPLIGGSEARHVWLLENAMLHARDAIASYYTEFCSEEEEDIANEEVNPLDLNCDRLGGTSEAGEMQYWYHNLRDLGYKSPHWDANDVKYLTFNPGYEGWNNTRLFLVSCNNVLSTCLCPEKY